MKCVLAVCADSAALDRSSNKVSLFAINDGISTLTFPYVLPSLAILFILRKEKGDRSNAKGEVELFFQPASGDSAEISKGKSPIRFDFEGTPKLRILIRTEGIAIDQTGTLIARIFHKKTVIGEWAMPVAVKKINK